MKILPILLLVVAACTSDPQPAPQAVATSASTTWAEVQPASQEVNDLVTKQFNPPAPYVCKTDPDGKVADFIRTHPTDPHAGFIPHGAVAYSCFFEGDWGLGRLAVAILDGKVVRWAD